MQVNRKNLVSPLNFKAKPIAPKKTASKALKLINPDQIHQTSKPSKRQPLQMIPLLEIKPVNNLDSKLSQSVSSAWSEWQSDVQEKYGKNRHPRIDLYAKTSHFKPGGEWCGFFVGFNYEQAGFKHTPSLASYPKARDFFLYRSITKTNRKANADFDQLRREHQMSGGTREYFMLPNSGNIKRVQSDPKRYGNFDLNNSIFNYQNLPIKSGDTALFKRGHVGMVYSYDQQNGKLVTLEGNTNGMGPKGKTIHAGVVMKEYDLSDPKIQEKFDGFGRPAPGDFE